MKRFITMLTRNEKNRREWNTEAVNHAVDNLNAVILTAALSSLPNTARASVSGFVGLFTREEYNAIVEGINSNDAIKGKIRAIKLVRERTGMGLPDAKNAVESEMKRQNLG